MELNVMFRFFYKQGVPMGLLSDEYPLSLRRKGRLQRSHLFIENTK